ncbi:MAG: hypothetical protein HQK60_06830 [Deltaproteobacteria bacterium]|nr:hypothetical protein [Deltaproteobacteria bacterium]
MISGGKDNRRKIISYILVLLVAVAAGMIFSAGPVYSCSRDLDCPAQMKCQDSACVDVGCLPEGGKIPGSISPEYRKHMATECCPGLVRIAWPKNFDGNCNRVPLMGGPAGICTRCGNGKCEKDQGETRCNCPADCN